VQCVDLLPAKVPRYRAEANNGADRIRITRSCGGAREHAFRQALPRIENWLRQHHAGYFVRLGNMCPIQRGSYAEVRALKHDSCRETFRSLGLQVRVTA